MTEVSFTDCGSNVANDEYDYLIKLLALGDSNVGKTTLLHRYVTGKCETRFSSTVGVDFKEKRIIRENRGTESLIGNRQRIHLQLWDTAGQERFRSLCAVFLRDAMGFMLVFDLTNESSLQNCRIWMEMLSTHAYSERPDVILVGNKSDLESKRTVSYDTAKSLADDLGCPYLETSAFSGNNVNDAFHTLLNMVMLRIEQAVDKSLPLLNKSSGANQQSGSDSGNVLSNIFKLKSDDKPPGDGKDSSSSSGCGC